MVDCKWWKKMMDSFKSKTIIQSLSHYNCDISCDTKVIVLEKLLILIRLVGRIDTRKLFMAPMIKHPLFH